MMTTSLSASQAQQYLDLSLDDIIRTQSKKPSTSSKANTKSTNISNKSSHIKHTQSSTLRTRHHPYKQPSSAHSSRHHSNPPKNSTFLNAKRSKRSDYRSEQDKPIQIQIVNDTVRRNVHKNSSKPPISTSHTTSTSTSISADPSSVNGPRRNNATNMDIGPAKRYLPMRRNTPSSNSTYASPEFNVTPTVMTNSSSLVLPTNQVMYLSQQQPTGSPFHQIMQAPTASNVVYLVQGPSSSIGNPMLPSHMNVATTATSSMSGNVPQITYVPVQTMPINSYPQYVVGSNDLSSTHGAMMTD